VSFSKSRLEDFIDSIGHVSYLTIKAD